MVFGNLYKFRILYVYFFEFLSLSVVIVSYFYIYVLSDVIVCNLVVVICGCLCSIVLGEVS